MKHSISGGRKTAYYAGSALMIAGGVSFLSVFVTAALNFANLSNFNGNAKSSMFRALLGMVLLMIGGVVRSIGISGLAGSDVVLNPEEASEDLEPCSRTAGGMLKEALNEARVNLSGNKEKVINDQMPELRQAQREGFEALPKGAGTVVTFGKGT